MAYFVFQDSETRGPFTFHQLKSMWNAGAVNLSASYKEEGFDDWVPISELLPLLEYQDRPRAASDATFREQMTKTDSSGAVLFVVILVLAGFMAWFVVAPHLKAREFKNAVLAKDANGMADCIDFPALRENVKDQLRVAGLKKLADEHSESKSSLESAGAAMGTALGLMFVDKLVDSLVTPVGLTEAMQGAKDQTIAPSRQPFEGARYGYETFSRFCIAVPAAEDDSCVFVFSRRGLSWKLTDLRFPAVR